MRVWATALLLAFTLFCEAEPEWVLVGNPQGELTSLSKEDLRQIYLGNRNSATRELSITAYDHKSMELRKSFYEEYLGLSLIELRAYWAKRVFTGMGRPPKQMSNEQLMNRLKSERSAMAYLPRESAAGLRVISLSD